jgi:hypothetical protein
MTSRLLIGQIIHMVHMVGKDQDLWRFDEVWAALLPFQRFLNQPIEHRHQIAGLLLQVPPHAPHIGAGVDQRQTFTHTSYTSWAGPMAER